MLDALVSGTTDPDVLAELAKGKLRAKLPALREALVGRFDRQHALIVSAIFAHLDSSTEQLQLLSDETRSSSPLSRRRLSCSAQAPACSDAPPRDPRRDRHRHGPLPLCASPRQLGRSVPGQRPLRRQAPLEQDRHGSKWLDTARTEAALAATRTQDVYLAAQYQRLRPRRGDGRALGAVKHSTLVACWHMLQTGELYREAGGDYFTQRDPERATQRLVAQLERLGHHVTLETAAPVDPPVAFLRR